MRRREIFIELTSLLDVILILLFILLMQAKTTTAQAVDAAAQAQTDVQAMAAEVDAAQEERDALRAEAQGLRDRAAEQEARANEQAERADALQRQLWTENLVLDNSLLLTVSVDKNGNIRLEKDGESVAIVAYDWADDTYAKNKLRGLLLDELRTTDREAVFLVFQYDRDRVYHAEYEAIQGIVQEIKQEARGRDIPLSFLEMDLTEA